MTTTCPRGKPTFAARCVASWTRCTAMPWSRLSVGEPRRGAGPAAPPRLSSQPAAQGVRQRPGGARRHARAHHAGGSCRILRGVSRVPILSGFRGARFWVRDHQGGPWAVALFRLFARSQTAPCGAGPPHRRVRSALVAWGVALAARGMDHGGLDERQMAAVDVRLTQEIHDAGLAGGIVFSWLDAWFKHTWVTIDLELPAERTRLWHNVMDAEQNYGLLGEYAGAADATPQPGGDAARWRGVPLVERSGAIALRVGAAPAYLYIVLDGGPGLDSTRYVVGIDTHAGTGGERVLPRVS